MSKISLFNNFNLTKIRKIASNRGVKGCLIHSYRRIGAMIETAILGPDVIRINPVGAQCNHACPMCWLKQLTTEEHKRLINLDKEYGLNFEDYRNFFRSIPNGVREVNIVGGGEPLLHKDIIPIFKEIKTYGWNGNLISNWH